MATASLSVVLGKLKDLSLLDGVQTGAQAGQELSLLADVQTEASKLETTLEIIQGFVEDADVKQMHQKSVKVWMRKLKEIMYDAEDVLDDWSTTTVAIRGYQRQKPVAVSRTAHIIKAIRDRLDSLIRDKNQLGLVAVERQEDNRPRLRTTSFVDASEICGRDDDKKTIMSRLVGESSQQHIHAHVPVISIVGMGGLGKTTLAQVIFKDTTIVNIFKLRMWVCISEPFDLQQVTKEIIERAGGTADNNSSLQALHECLSALVQGKRFLLVLDDVWSEEPNDWTPLKHSLDAGAPGSRIIVTTRKMGVADMMGSKYAHRLGVLSNDDCCSLFWKIVFSRRPQEELQKFKEVGDDIAKKCKGIPLSVKVIASLMPRKRTIQDWRNVLSNEIWDPKVQEKLLPALLLSYYDLPTSLKQCFAYCAIFPKDTGMYRDELVQLWMAQGYLGLDDEKELEIIGLDYFEELAMRSFFQDIQEDRWEKEKVTCKMHDLVHDLAHFLTEYGYYLHQIWGD